MNYRRTDIEALVRQVVARTLGQEDESANQAGQPGRAAQRPILDEAAVRQMPVGSAQRIAAHTVVTPLARQAALERRIHLLPATDQAPGSGEQPFPGRDYPSANRDKKVVALGADHGGYHLKEQLKAMLQKAESEYTVIDCGAHSTEAVDYPDFAYAVARLVADGRAWRGIVIDGAGIGSCMVANKVPGVRAAMCYDQATAVNSREHNNANVLTLGAGLIGPNLAQQITQTWLATEFGGGRHARRVDKIDQIDKRFSK
jgi:ribose 5-phosphate isomerase B